MGEGPMTRAPIWDPNVDQGTQRKPGSVRKLFWRILYIAYSLEVGIFLMFLPWLDIWENNYLLFRYPHLRGVLLNSFLRGAILGLGLVNIMIGIQEIAKLRKIFRHGDQI